MQLGAKLYTLHQVIQQFSYKQEKITLLPALTRPFHQVI